MKKWTVMLIPHDRGDTRTMTLSQLPLWVFATVLVVLTFAASFFFYQNQTYQEINQKWKDAHRSQALNQNHATPEVLPGADVENEYQRQVEALRAEYEASNAEIAHALVDLYAMETKARSITGMAPRGRTTQDAEKVGDGKGGSFSGLGAFGDDALDELIRPSNIIYGMSRPSADLILQEVHLRTQSFTDLVSDMELHIDRIDRTPSIWPLKDGAGYLSSKFGYRRDPFNKRVRFHSGIDLAAYRGTKVLASAKGVVTSSVYESGLGNVIRIDHGDGVETWYGHLSKRLVKKGDAVSREDIIGHVGNTGHSKGDHLHYEVHVNGKAVDGRKYITD
jgi:murein DD-endopeptidase MepM/ murein hydrolase activator NlpD